MPITLSITITSPMPGGVHTPTFTISGTYVNTFRSKDEATDRNLLLRTTSTISVTATKGASSYGPFPVTAMGGNWTASASLPPGTGYSINASISDGTDTASHSIETVDVQTTPIIQIITITPPPPPMVADVMDLAKKSFVIDGKHTDGDADEMFAFPYTLLRIESTTNLPSGGKHYRVRYLFGSPVDDEGVGGDVDKPGKKWKLKKINVEPAQFVMVFLKKGGNVIAKNTSRLF